MCVFHSFSKVIEKSILSSFFVSSFGFSGEISSEIIKSLIFFARSESCLGFAHHPQSRESRIFTSDTSPITSTSHGILSKISTPILFILFTREPTSFPSR